MQTYENNKDKAENPIERDTIHDLPDVYGLESLADHASDKDRPLPGLAGSINVLARRYTSKNTWRCWSSQTNMITLNVTANVIAYEKFHLKKRKYEIYLIKILRHISIKKWAVDIKK